MDLTFHFSGELKISATADTSNSNQAQFGDVSPTPDIQSPEVISATCDWCGGDEGCS